MDAEQIPSRDVLGVRIDATSYADASRRILAWAARRESRFVVCATVNNVMESHDDPGLLAITNRGDLVTPDGMPLVWALRLLGAPGATRVYGPDLTATVLPAAARAGIPVGFYGSSPAVLARLVDRVRDRWPELRVPYCWSPPFRDLTPEEDARVVEEINASGAAVLFVGLGCPRQERWMAAHRGRVEAAMVGVGAAFDFMAGTKRQAPRMLQRAGLEWLFRLASEPRRLWRRYLRHNPRFVLLFGAQLGWAWMERLRSAWKGGDAS